MLILKNSQHFASNTYYYTMCFIVNEFHVFLTLLLFFLCMSKYCFSETSSKNIMRDNLITGGWFNLHI